MAGRRRGGTRASGPGVTDPTPAVLPPLAGIAAVLGAGVLALVAVRRVRARRGLSDDAAREARRLALSAVAVALPWVFDAAWPVIAVAVVCVLALAAAHVAPALRGGAGRPTLGDVCFPVAVAALYLLAGGSPVLYAVPLLLLGVAGPAAALVGRRHGLAPFATVEGTKSREGSAAFAAVAFLCVHVPLLLFTPVGRPESLWIAAIVAGLAAIVEAVSWRGLDNLFVPLGAYAVLLRLLTFDATLLAGHAAVLAALVGLAGALRSETTVGGAGVFGAALVAYLVWALGGTAWLLPPALVYLLYARIWPAAREADGLPHDPARRPHTAHNVFSVSSVGVLWLLAARALDLDLLFPYALAWGASLAFLGVDRMREARPAWGAPALAWRAAWRSTLVVVAPVLAVVWLRVAAGVPAAPPAPVAATAAFLAAGLAATGGAAFVLARYKGAIDERTSAFEGRLARAAVVAPLSALGLVALAVA